MNTTNQTTHYFILMCSKGHQHVLFRRRAMDPWIAVLLSCLCVNESCFSLSYFCSKNYSHVHHPKIQLPVRYLNIVCHSLRLKSENVLNQRSGASCEIMANLIYFCIISNLIFESFFRTTIVQLNLGMWKFQHSWLSGS